MNRNRFIAAALFCAMLLATLVSSGSLARPQATPGLPFTEDFSTTDLRDASRTTANWDTQTGELVQAWRRARYDGFKTGMSGYALPGGYLYATSLALGDVDGDGDLDLVVGRGGQLNLLFVNYGSATPFGSGAGVEIGATPRDTTSLALGDMDRDGDLDLVVGNLNATLQLYLNNGTSNPFDGVSAQNLTEDAFWSMSIALGDMDSDGDLDVVAGTQGNNCLFLNNGSSAPFQGVSGSTITNDDYNTDEIALGDLNTDGYLDVVAGNNAFPSRYYLNNGSSAPFAGVTGLNLTGDAYDTRSLTLGDVNGDAHLDVITGNYITPNRLYLNNGTSTPFAGVAGVNVDDTFRNSYALALADFNSDGDLDLAAGNFYQSNLVYQNTGLPQPFAGVTPASIANDTTSTNALGVGDLDGDGDLDLVMGRSDEPSLVYLNPSSPNPFPKGASKLITGDTLDTPALAAGDLDADGDQDLVVGVNDAPSRLYLNNGTSDPFNGVSGVDIGSTSRPYPCLALGDVDHDGDLDLALGYYNHVPRLFLNNGTADPFSGVSGYDFAAGFLNTHAIQLGDIDGDGLLDAVLGNEGQYNYLFLNDGTAAPFNSTAGTTITNDIHDTRSIALGDVDNDGDVDVAAGNYNQANRLYLNNGTSDPFSGVVGVNITSDVRNTVAIALADMTGDGALDLVAGNVSQVSRLYLNNGTSNPFNGVSGTDISSDAEYLYSIAVGDVDSDGDLDLLVGNDNDQNRLYLNNGSAAPFSGVSSMDAHTDLASTRSLILADMNGDSRLDFLVGNHGSANRLYLNSALPDPLVGWIGQDIFTDSYGLTAIEAGDMDNDGDLDLVTGNFGHPPRLYLNNGLPLPFLNVSGTDITSDAYHTQCLALGDLDGDGDLDVATGNQEEPNRYYLNNGSANPFDGVTGRNVPGTSYNTLALALGDVNHDGALDLVIGVWNAPPRIYLNTGTSIPFGPGDGQQITTDVFNTYAIALGDMNKDGFLDLVAGNEDDPNRLYLNSGDDLAPFFAVGGMNITSDAYAARALAIGDVNQDGWPDLVVGNTGQANRLYVNNGCETLLRRPGQVNGCDPFDGVTGSNITSDVYSKSSIALVDYDRDGDLDLLSGDNHPNHLYLNTGSHTDPFGGASAIRITNDNYPAKSLVAADLNGDGDLDLATGVGNSTLRMYQRWLFNGAWGWAASLRVDAEAVSVHNTTLTQAKAFIPNTGVTYWLSNNGGTRWYIAHPGLNFVFPTTGSDLRWKAGLRSLSPFLTPYIQTVYLSRPVYLFVPVVMR